MNPPGPVLVLTGMSQDLSSEVVPPPRADGKLMHMCACSSRCSNISLLPFSSQHLPALLPLEPPDSAILQAMENELPVPHTCSSASVPSSASGVSSSSGGSGRLPGPQISVYSGIPDRQTVQVRFQLISD